MCRYRTTPNDIMNNVYNKNYINILKNTVPIRIYIKINII